jgi:hypothetical protein
VSEVKPSDSPRTDSSKAGAAVPLKVKVAEPVASSAVPSQAPKPAPSDHMAALRRAKDAITQQQHSALPICLVSLQCFFLFTNKLFFVYRI